MQEAMARASGADLTSVGLMTRKLDFEEKKRAFLDLLRYRSVPLDQYDRICRFLRIPYGLVALCNDIAHSGWIFVRHTAWIQPDWILHLPPGVMPSPGDSDAQSVEGPEGKNEYPIDDLVETVRSLSANHEEFSNYLREIRLIPVRAVESNS